MTLKYNILTNKLGLSELPKTKINFYGKYSTSFKNKYFNLLHMYYYLCRATYKKKNLLTNLKLSITKNNIVVIYCCNKKNIKSFEPIIPFINKINKPLKLNIYKVSQIRNSSFGVLNYFKYILEEKNQTFKKTLEEIKELINKEKNIIKIINTRSGLKKVYLVGYNIQIKGCFEPSNNQMAKIFYDKNGSTPINRLNNYVEYSNSSIHTKYGTGGIKIWLFYKFCEDDV